MAEDKKWYYYNQYGTMHKGWLNLDGTWYYFENNGEMKTGWLSLDGGGHRRIRENITTGMYCSDMLQYLSSYTFEECLETIIIEDVGNKRTYTYYFENKGDDEWTWNDDEVVLYLADYQDLNRLP